MNEERATSAMRLRMRRCSAADRPSWARAWYAAASASATLGSSEKCPAVFAASIRDVQPGPWLDSRRKAGACVRPRTSARARASCRVAPVCPTSAALACVYSMAALTRTNSVRLVRYALAFASQVGFSATWSRSANAR